VESFDALVRELGGKEARLTYDGRPYRVHKFKSFVPRNHFPIISESDLVTKAKGLERHLERPRSAKKGKRLN
jgi:hypothetical protein